MARIEHVSPTVLRRQRRLAGLPIADGAGAWWRRILASRWVGMAVVGTVLYLGLAYWDYFSQTTEPSDDKGALVHSLVAVQSAPLILAGALFLLAMVPIVALDLARRERLPGAALGVAWATWVATLAHTGLGWWDYASLAHRPNLAPEVQTGIRGMVGWLVAGSVVSVLGLVGFALLRRLRPRYVSSWLIAAAAGLAGFVGTRELAWWGVFSRNESGAFVGEAAKEAMAKSAQAALPTLLVLLAAFLLIDRWRPQRFVTWWLALGWGGTVATFLAGPINSWANAVLAKARGADSDGIVAQTAVYIAPFVEEALKASVVFLIVAALRNQVVSRLSTLCLGGLSAIGFAFTENIGYYARVFMGASQNLDKGDAQLAFDQIVQLRGFYTAWGHPFFTSFTALGIAFGMRARSKTARILYPLGGYCLAATGHMTFNWRAGMPQPMSQILLFNLIVGISIVVSFVIFAVTNTIVEGRRLRARLVDYARMGWLRVDDIRTYGTLWSRLKLTVLALFSFPWPMALVCTIQMFRRITALGYLRDAMTRGLVDGAGLDEERRLFAEIRSLRGRALDESGRRPRRPKQVIWSAPAYPGPAGIGGNWPAPATVGQQTRYSAVDPKWAPPA